MFHSLCAIFILSYLLFINNTHAVTWTNWGKNQQSNPHEIFYPESREEIVHIIKQAHEKNLTVRAYGSGHSWSNVACTDGYLINTDKLNKILSVDTKNRLVKIEGGIKIKDLKTQLKEHNLDLQNFGSDTIQSMAGAIATATHGTGQTGTYSDFIEEIELITADGNDVTLSPTSYPNLFAAARVNIGCLGIVYALTIRCKKLREHRLMFIKTDFDEVMTNYKKLRTDHKYFSFFWCPYTNGIVIGHLLNHLLKKKLKENKQPKITFIKGSPQFSAKKNHPSFDYHFESEIAVPMDSLPQALVEIQKIFPLYEQEGFTLLRPVSVRFAQAESATYLSPAVDQDVAYLCFSTPPEEQYFALFKDVEEQLYKLGGRPHWGKINFLTHEKVKELYGENLDKFLAAKKRLDPHGMFSNEFTKRVLDGE